MTPLLTVLSALCVNIRVATKHVLETGGWGSCRVLPVRIADDGQSVSFAIRIQHYGSESLEDSDLYEVIIRKAYESEN